MKKFFHSLFLESEKSDREERMNGEREREEEEERKKEKGKE